MGKSKSKNYEAVRNFKMVIESFDDKSLDSFKNSIQDLVKEADKVVDEGGHMRVDTGFLRSSGVAAINEIPHGPSEGRKRNPGETGVLPEYDGYNPTQAVSATLPKLKHGDTFYFGWTAHYASIREAYDGFLESAVQKWPEIVENNARSLKE